MLKKKHNIAFMNAKMDSMEISVLIGARSVSQNVSRALPIFSVHPVLRDIIIILTIVLSPAHHTLSCILPMK